MVNRTFEILNMAETTKQSIWVNGIEVRFWCGPRILSLCAQRICVLSERNNWSHVVVKCVVLLMQCIILLEW